MSDIIERLTELWKFDQTKTQWIAKIALDAIAEIKMLRTDTTCQHRWIMNKRGDLPLVFFNGTNAYVQCEICGHKKKT